MIIFKLFQTIPAYSCWLLAMSQLLLLYSKKNQSFMMLGARTFSTALPCIN